MHLDKLRKAISTREMKLIGFIILLLIFLSFSTENFFTLGNLRDILTSASYVIVGAIGMTLIILTGNIDISVGSMLAVLSIIAGSCSKAGWSPFPYLLFVIFCGCALGAFNGLLITKFDVPSVIVTLAMMSIYRGAIVFITGGAWVNALPDSFNIIGKGLINGIPIPIIITAVIVAVSMWLMKYTNFSKKICAVGSNKEAAILCGINTKKVIFIIFVIAGFLMGISSILYATRFTNVVTNSGQGFEMTLIAATVLGGTKISGGNGKIIGTVLGAILLGLIGTALTFLKVSSYWEQTVQGVLIFMAMYSGNAKTANLFSRKKVI